MSFLQNFARSFSVTIPKPVVHLILSLDLSDNTPDCNDTIVSLVQYSQTQRDLSKSSDDSSTLLPHEGVDHNASQSQRQHTN